MVFLIFDVVIVINEVGEVVEFNGVVEQIFGYSCDEVMGQLMVDLIILLKYCKVYMEGMCCYLIKGIWYVVGKGCIQMEVFRKLGEVFFCEFLIFCV